MLNIADIKFDYIEDRLTLMFYDIQPTPEEIEHYAKGEYVIEEIVQPSVYNGMDNPGFIYMKKIKL